MTVHVQSISPGNCPALVLNADFRPLSYYPLSIWCWQDAIKAVFLDRVNILSEYDTRVRSPSFEMRLPSVVSLKSYVKPTRFPAFTRFNVFLRDRFTCQYCGEREELTFDHVIPRSKGGVTSWENVVAACSVCNLRKADMLPSVARMWPATEPYQPTVHDLHQRGIVDNEGQTFYDLNAIALSAFGIAAVAALISVRRRRPWDAAMFAVAPALFVSATVNWDLFTVGLAAIAMTYWAKRKPALAGLFLGLATAAKFYPVLILGALLVLSLRTGKWRDFFITFGTGLVTWLAINLPIAYLYWDSWSRFWDFNSKRGIDWGTVWYIGAHFPRGSGQYGFPYFQQLDLDPEHATLNILYLGAFIIGCVLILILGLTARKEPRLAQLAFLIVAAFLITGKVWSQQYVLWLLPLAIMARPKWGAFLAWQAAEVIYFVSFYGELMGASGRQVFPEGIFVVASVLRLVTLCVLVGFVIRDIRHPEEDVVRQTYEGEDPDGGVYNLTDALAADERSELVKV